MNRKVWLTLLIAVLLIAAGIFLLSQKIPSLLEGYIEKALAAQGVENFNLGKPYWGISGAGTSHLRIRGLHEGWQFSFDLYDVQANYHWRTLLNGEIRSIFVGRMDARLLRLANPEETPAQAFELRQWLDELKQLRLPVDKISLAQLAFNLQTESGRFTLNGSDIAINSLQQSLAGRLTAEGNVADTTLPTLQIYLQPNRNFSWVPAVELHAYRDGKLLVEGTTSLAATENPALAGQLEFSFHSEQQDTYNSLSPWLKGFQALQSLPPAYADLAANGTIGLPPSFTLANLSLNDFPLEASLRGNTTMEAIPGSGLSGVTATFELQLINNGDEILVTPIEPLTFSGTLASAQWPEIADLAGWKGHLPLSATITGPDPALWLNTNGLPQIAAQGEKLQLSLKAGEGDSQLLSDIVLESWSVHGNRLTAIADAEITAPYQGTALPTAKVTGKLTGTGSSMNLDGGFSLPDWDITGRYQFAHNSDLTVKAEAQVSDLSLVSAQGEQYGIDIRGIELASGSASMELSLQQPFGKPAIQTYDFNAENLSGIAHGLAFKDVSINGTVRGGNNWYSTSPIHLTAKEVSSGVVISNLAVMAELRKSDNLANTHWKLTTLKGKLFSGDISLAAPADIVFPLSGNRVSILLSNLDLTEILGLYEKQGVRGTGLISGEIPLVLSGEGVRIHNGQLKSLEAGKIVVATSGAMKATNEQFAMALRLLENFNYDTLEISANFETTGDLELGVQLRGRNPDEFDGRQVNFNINLEQNLYKLFNVLKLTDDITTEIEARLQKQR